MDSKTLHMIQYTSYVLIIIGAVNWGLIGFFNLDLVSTIFGEMSIISRLVYSLVGISALVNLAIEIRKSQYREKEAHSFS